MEGLPGYFRYHFPTTVGTFAYVCLSLTLVLYMYVVCVCICCAHI